MTYTQAAKDAIFNDGYDKKFGARHLKRSIEHNIVFPLTIFMSAKEVGFGDLVTVDYKDGEFEFETTVSGATAAVITAKQDIRNKLEAKEREKHAPFKKTEPPKFESFI